MHAASDYVRAHIDPLIKREAAAVLAKMGLSVSDLCRMALTMVATEKCLPFKVEIPNALTQETMAKVLRGEDLHKAKDLNDLISQLEN